MNYINESSFKCLLGPQSKNIVVNNNLFMWVVGKKQHFCVEGELTIDNIDNLKQFGPSNFHYMSESNIEILKKSFKVSKSKKTSIILDITDLSFAGNEYKSIRHCINRCKKQNFTIQNDYNHINDVKDLIEEWSNEYTDKYFRDNSGKNMHFYKNRFHEGLNSVFIYEKDKLLAFGTLSNPKDGYCSYILGKALYKRAYGLSEFADIELYKLGKARGIRHVNMGEASKGLLEYKTKFKHIKETHFDGSIE